jgi:hypothetical protein
MVYLFENIILINAKKVADGCLAAPVNWCNGHSFQSDLFVFNVCNRKELTDGDTWFFRKSKG